MKYLVGSGAYGIVIAAEDS